MNPKTYEPNNMKFPYTMKIFTFINNFSQFLKIYAILALFAILPPMNTTTYGEACDDYFDVNGGGILDCLRTDGNVTFGGEETGQEVTVGFNAVSGAQYRLAFDDNPWKGFGSILTGFPNINYCVGIPSGGTSNDTYAYGRLNPTAYLIGSPFYEDVDGDGLTDEMQQVHVQPTVFTEGPTNWISFWAWLPNTESGREYEMYAKPNGLGPWISVGAIITGNDDLLWIWGVIQQFIFENSLTIFAIKKKGYNVTGAIQSKRKTAASGLPSGLTESFQIITAGPEHFEIGSTYEFKITGSTLPSNIRHEIRDINTSAIKKSGNGSPFSITFSSTQSGELRLTFYSDTDGNSQLNSGESRVDSPIFVVGNIRQLTVNVRKSANAGATNSSIDQRFTDATKLLLKKNNSSDQRALINIKRGNTTTFTPGGGEGNDPVNIDLGELTAHFNKNTFTFVNRIEDSDGDLILGATLIGAYPKIIVSWQAGTLTATGKGSTVAHEIGHGFGLKDQFVSNLIMNLAGSNTNNKLIPGEASNYDNITPPDPL